MYHFIKLVLIMYFMHITRYQDLCLGEPYEVLEYELLSQSSVRPDCVLSKMENFGTEVTCGRQCNGIKDCIYFGINDLNECVLCTARSGYTPSDAEGSAASFHIYHSTNIYAKAVTSGKVIRVS